MAESSSIRFCKTIIIRRALKQIERKQVDETIYASNSEGDLSYSGLERNCVCNSASD
jgi:hypothetical protein